MEPENEPTAPKASKPRVWVLAAVVALAALAGFLLLRRSAPPSPVASPAIQGSPDALIQGSPVLLNAKAAIIADRYDCLCGECADTLGKCICTRDQGSNEMKSTLNRLALEKKTLAEIDAAMVEKYGTKVLSSAPEPAPAGTSK